ncbi:WD40-repeat-containing domain protein [Multifurca ochricompacta]|uniref:WD40-repeat-containing domain protein n=1 Tax=Multifurca ochricompacta TaxID=376703 RepID=A0AAD4M1R2_9AGAM|nr:WD40-repeat-containing domain protein [Multifurca ochricompacta]
MNLLWSRSRNTAISHEPLHSSISAIHPMSDNALLSASIQYGVVARSFPFKGKVLSGYLNATGVLPGLGNGNPNTDFTPNISACVLTSNGTIAKVLWGRRDGSVSIVSHPRTMSGTQAPARIHTSSVQQEHEDAVLDGTWAANGDAFVTAGADGRVKVWTVNPFLCVWTSERHVLGLETDAVLKVVEDLANGFIVSASRSGDIIILSGFDVLGLSTTDVPPHHIQKLCISSAFLKSSVESPATQQPSDVLALYIQASSHKQLNILACYEDKTQFFLCVVDMYYERVDVKTFGDEAFGIIRCIQPAFSNDPTEPNFVIAGTQLGIISVYDWHTTSPLSHPLPASRHVDVFADAHITTLAVNSFVIAAGSSRGTIRVLDLLTFETLRTFAAPMSSDVRQIELTENVMVASVGSKVLAWSAVHSIPGGKDPVRIKGKGRQEVHGKWFKQVELRNDIAETKKYLAEEPHGLQRNFDPEREQMMQLHTLGLSEREAVEYTLMLSRDEELQRHQNCTGHVHGEWRSDTDESSGRQSGSGSDHSSPPSSPSGAYHSSSPPLRPTISGSSSSTHGRVAPLASPSTLDIKVQVSPRFHPEPKEAGGLSGSPLGSQSMLLQGSSPSSTSRSYSQSMLRPTSDWATSQKLVANGNGAPSLGKQNAWNKPLPGTGSPASPPVSTRLPPLPSLTRSNLEAEAERIRRIEDLELRFALELSLAEAQSKEVKCLK